MLALVATPRFLLLVDLESRRVSVIEDGRQEYYGITWRPGGDQLILSHSGLDNESLVDLESYALSEVGWISAGPLHSSRFLSQPHQILCGPDGRVICTNTGRNSVVVIDPARPGHYQETQLHPDRWDRLEPTAASGLHLNSLFLEGDTLTVLAHGFEQGSQLITLSYPSLERVDLRPIPGLTGMHNYCVTRRGERIACASSRGMLVDPVTLAVHWRGGSAGYLRGLAVGSDRVLVGESPRVGRHLRSSAVSGLWVIDRDSWMAVDYFVLGPYGVVNEVRLLDDVDEAHHGHRFEGLEALRQQDACRSKASAKLTASRRLAELVVNGPFELLLGEPEVSGEGWWSSPTDLCLMLTRGERPTEVGLRYDFRGEDEGGQCGIVVGCLAHDHDASPSLRDTDMDVVVATRRGVGGVTLAHWRHDGTAWRQQQIVAEVDGLMGCLGVRRDNEAIVIHAGGAPREVARIPLAELPHVDARWGVRWQAVSVVPECGEGEPGNASTAASEESL